ncbi:hypothetical protein CCAN12_570001 [Capnocytophaga canimorsus]|uniref:Uncharacterized protein n=1 Tax=Capnocytophaga canimorsus TaxID=28188 RepID=A0A0B7HB89_9FLAO|nr:hypothetical protein CCAN12_570001 [Capnocytophaga canimorsus]
MPYKKQTIFTITNKVKALHIPYLVLFIFRIRTFDLKIKIIYRDNNTPTNL